MEHFTPHLRLLLLMLALLCGSTATPGQAPQVPGQSDNRRPATTDSGSVTIRTALGSPKRGVPVVVLVDKKRVRVRERVAFTLVAIPGSSRRFTVNFGDGSEIQTTSTQLEYHYERVGHYDVYAWLTPDRNPDQPPGVSLSATPTAAAPGRPVKFVAQLSSPYPNVRYRFAFGDGEITGWENGAETEHSFSSEGTFQAYLEIGAGGAGSGRAAKLIGRSNRVAIQVTQPAPRSVSLTATPNPAEVGTSITFTAAVLPPGSNVVYQFSFGDGSGTTGWQSNPQTTHTYTSVRTHPASVEIGVASGGGIKAVGSARESVRVTQPLRPTPTPTPTPAPTSTPTPTVSPSPGPTTTASPSPTGFPVESPAGSVVPPGTVTTASPGTGQSGGWLNLRSDDWWKYLLIVLLLAGGAYWAWTALVPPRPSFAAHPDLGGAEVNAGAQPLSIESQIILNPNVAEGQYLVYGEEPNIVRSVRRSDG